MHASATSESEIRYQDIAAPEQHIPLQRVIRGHLAEEELVSRARPLRLDIARPTDNRGSTISIGRVGQG
jgi:hypothetical protein